MAVTKHAATLDTEPVASSYPGGSHTHLFSNHFQYARGIFLFNLLWNWVASGGLQGTAWAILVSAVFDCLLFSVSTCILFWLKRDSQVKLRTSL